MYAGYTPISLWILPSVLLAVVIFLFIADAVPILGAILMLHVVLGMGLWLVYTWIATIRRIATPVLTKGTNSNNKQLPSVLKTSVGFRTDKIPNTHLVVASDFASMPSVATTRDAVISILSLWVFTAFVHTLILLWSHVSHAATWQGFYSFQPDSPDGIYATSFVWALLQLLHMTSGDYGLISPISLGTQLTTIVLDLFAAFFWWAILASVVGIALDLVQCHDELRTTHVHVHSILAHKILRPFDTILRVPEWVHLCTYALVFLALAALTDAQQIVGCVAYTLFFVYYGLFVWVVVYENFYKDSMTGRHTSRLHVLKDVAIAIVSLYVLFAAFYMLPILYAPKTMLVEGHPEYIYLTGLRADRPLFQTALSVAFYATQLLGAGGFGMYIPRHIAMQLMTAVSAQIQFIFVAVGIPIGLGAVFAL